MSEETVIKKAYDSNSISKQKKKVYSKIVHLDKTKVATGSATSVGTGTGTGAGTQSGSVARLTGTFDKTSGSTNDKKMGKNTLGRLGFKTAKPTLNFYDHWKIEDYPGQVVGIFEMFLKSVGVGVVPLNAHEDDWVGSFLQTLHEKLSAECDDHYGLIPKGNRKLLRPVLEKLEEVIANQKKLEHIVRGQSLIRGYLTRKNFRTWLGEKGIKYTKSKRHVCNLAFRELLNSEHEYIKDLEAIVNKFLIPLKKISELKRTSISISDMASILPSLNPQNAVSLTKEDISSIFSNVETILGVHKRVVNRLEELNEEWPFITNYGAVFLNIAPELVVYGEFAQNSKTAVDTVVRVQDSDPKFKSFLDEASMNGADLVGLLVRPLNHINHYSACLRVLVYNTPSDDADTDNLRNAYAAIKKTGKFIQDMYQNASNRAKIADIQRRGIFPKGITFDHAPKRQFITEGQIIVIERPLAFDMEKQRLYFIFNDTFIHAEESGKQLKICHILPLKECTLEEVNHPTGFRFAIVQGPNKIIFQHKSIIEKQSLMKKLKELIDNLNITHKMFGVGLDKILEREKPVDGVPFLLRCCAESIKKNGKEMEGIFRLSGGTAEVANLRDKFSKLEQIPKEPLDLKEHSPYAVAAVMKMFFRELPEPIFTFKAFKPLTSVKIDDQDPKVSIAEIKQIIANVPTENIVVLKFLAQFLVAISRYSSVNKMNLSNLAIVFGPNLCFASEETLETILLIPKLNGIFQFIFENSAVIFDM